MALAPATTTLTKPCSVCVRIDAKGLKWGIFSRRLKSLSWLSSSCTPPENAPRIPQEAADTQQHRESQLFFLHGSQANKWTSKKKQPARQSRAILLPSFHWSQTNIVSPKSTLIFFDVLQIFPPSVSAGLARTESLSAGSAEVWAASCVSVYILQPASQPASHAHSSQGTPPTCLWDASARGERRTPTQNMTEEGEVEGGGGVSQP